MKGNLIPTAKRPIIFSLLLGVVVAGLFLVGVPIQFPIYTASDITVTSEQQLVDAVFDAPNSITPYVIELRANISLSTDTTLTIPKDKNITLTGNYRLIGADGQPTITVDGTLTIDGITVTHAAMLRLVRAVA